MSIVPAAFFALDYGERDPWGYRPNKTTQGGDCGCGAGRLFGCDRASEQGVDGGGVRGTGRCGQPFISSACLFFHPLSDKRVEGQRSINLVLSSRGLAALATINPSLAERVMEHAIPIHSRMIHMKDGGASGLQYDPHRQASRVQRPMPIAHLTVPNRRSIP